MSGCFAGPYQLGEFVQQSWFVAKVSSLPAALFAIPFGATIALPLYQLLDQFGAASATGAGGSAVAADLGARWKIAGVTPL